MMEKKMIEALPHLKGTTVQMESYANRKAATSSYLKSLYDKVYINHPERKNCFSNLLKQLDQAHASRPGALKLKDEEKRQNIDRPWFLSHELCGMSMYVDRFFGSLQLMQKELNYFQNLGVNFLHLMPLFESPKNESDGGYAVSNYRKVDKRFGTLHDLENLQKEMQDKGMYLMLDIVLNHTSQRHEWAEKARAGEKKYQDYFYFFNDRTIPDELEKTMPEIFPESSPGNFTYVPGLDKWVMTVFHNYQWDLNFSNPEVFNEMIDVILFYANLGVDVVRIDAPAFIWKKIGTNCQNLDEAHTLLQLIKSCVQLATPGMALLAEAIVSPAEIMKYFGEGNSATKECDLAYNATQMALSWDALATGDIRVMLAAQSAILKKPFGTTWLTYTRCHDDIGLGYDDETISHAGFQPYAHRKFIKNYYSGKYPNSPATGALFSVNEATGDARISGTLASLCGLEKALETHDRAEIKLSISKIMLMQSLSFFIGGIPVLFYGDEKGYCNQYDFLTDPDKSYDNRWMHRPVIKDDVTETEAAILQKTKRLIQIRKQLPVIADLKNLTWVNTENNHVAAFLRAWEDERVYCLFNFSDQPQRLSWYIFKQHGLRPAQLKDHWTHQEFMVGKDQDHFELLPYQFSILESV